MDGGPIPQRSRRRYFRGRYRIINCIYPHRGQGGNGYRHESKVIDLTSGGGVTMGTGGHVADEDVLKQGSGLYYWGSKLEKVPTR